ncbi:MAG: hypothetical protein SH859_07985 [Hyphomicrobium aestuarii]|nr:hypothetical protein [Hyphomicrobium aestuarii]
MIAFDPGTIKFVLLFGGAFVVAVFGLAANARRAREFERQRARQKDDAGL